MAQLENLRAKTITGFLWTGGELLGSQGIKFAIQIFLARLLVPADFGIIGMITIFIAISQSLIDSGFQNALIRELKVTSAACTTVFTFNIISAALLYGLLYISAPLIAQFYDTAILVAVVRVIGVVIPINALSLISRTLVMRRLAFKMQMQISLVGSLLAGGLAIGLALADFGVWAIVWQMVAAQIFQTIGFLWLAKWRPHWEFDFSAFQHLFQFGWKLTASGLIRTLYSNLLYVIIGRFFSVSTLGYFTNAEKISRVMTDTTTTAVRQVSYPALSRLQKDTTALYHGYQHVILHTIYLVFPLLVGVGVLAKPLILLIFGQQWAPAVPFLLPLCLTGLFFPLQALNLSILQVIGRSDLFLRLELIKKAVGLSVFAVVFLFQLNIMVLIWLLVLQELFSYVLDSSYAGKFVHYNTWAQFRDSSKIFLLVAIMGFTVKGFTLLLPTISWLYLLADILIGAIIYIGGSYLFKIQQLPSCWRIVQQVLSQSNKQVKIPK